MAKKIIGHGAEAIIYLEKNEVTKKRLSKKYRHPELDKKIIKRRTKAETKILKKAAEFIPVPKTKNQEESDLIKMEFIDGLKLSEHLDSFSKIKQKKILFQIGELIGKLHKEKIIHGDLTTSNMILNEKEIYLIDFGLGFFNGKYEDKGVDIHLLKQALEAKHFKNATILFEEFEKGYSSIEAKEAKKVFERMKAIEKRGRYKH